jgi:Family of unknown function (DUF6093)
MATRTGPNLAFATKTFRRFFDDTCRITVDAGNPNDAADDVLDELTGELTPPTGSVRTIYSGACKFSPQLTSEPRWAHEGEGVEGKRFYNFSLPINTVTIPIGAKITVTSSRRDPRSVGEVFYAREQVINSWAIQCKIVAEHRTVV